jgi:signal transduction histidine kinase
MAVGTVRQIQSKLLQTEKMAAVGQLVSGIAHESNNPLTAIMGYGQLRQLMKGAAVILLAAAGRQAEILRMVAEGEVEFVARHGEFIPLAACLEERRLRWAQRPRSSGGSPWAEMPDDAAEIFRHEINNPLTGILGNAELLLSHGVRLPAADTQRLQTVVDLAVRLRETVRRLSDAWDSQTRLLKSSAPRSASGDSLA